MQTDPRSRIVQPSGLHASPGFFRRDLFPVDLARIGVVTNGPPSGTVQFVVTTPEVRTRVRFSLVYVPAVAGGNPVDTLWPQPKPPGFTTNFGATSLWLCKRDESCNGSGERVPVENLVGDVYTPRPLPDNGCLGFTVDAESCNDEIYGRFFVDGTDLAAGGKWVLRVSATAYQEVSQREWDRLVGKLAIRVISSADLTPGGPR